MARPTLQLHPRKEPAVAHPAATLLLLRDGALGVEVLMTRRSPNASFLPGAYVFPGGRVDADDHQTHTLARAPDAGGRYRTAALAALRETFEELGILLAVQADGRPITRTHLQALDRSRALYPQLQAQGWSLAVDQARMLACWTTDRSVPKRFDTVFFAALMPDQQEPVADEMEQFEPVWVRPQDALAQHQAGNFFMIFPTIRTLHWLSAFEQAGQALAACTEDEPLWNSTPRGGLVGGQPQRFMEQDLPYAELALVCPSGQLEHALDWQHERPVPLLRHLHRLTAPNASVMTGPGTNSYIVGDAASGYIVIDPGPLLNDHIERLLAFTAGQITAIVCTHSHADHSPAARPLA
ncbi:NUDIX domain-containing protein, partial [Rhodoferax sp.]